MMAWLTLALLIGAALAALLRLGVPRDLASFGGAALMLGAAGYALQGRPGLPGAPAAPVARTTAIDPNLSVLRDAMFGRFGTSAAYFTAGDAQARAGSPRSATTLYLGAIDARPNDAALWTGLGGAYADQDGTVSPAARLSFERAMKLAPEHPGPTFFLGLALVRAGEFREAQNWWRRAYRQTPAAFSYRRDIAYRLTLLETYLNSEIGQSGR